MTDLQKETEKTLARIRKTIRDSKHLMEEAQLRMAETDRLLEEQGLTREKVKAMQFSPEQIAKVNAELERRGLPKIEQDTVPQAAQDPVPLSEAIPPRTRSAEVPESCDVDADAVNRSRKMNVMMQRFKL